MKFIILTFLLVAIVAAWSKPYAGEISPGRFILVEEPDQTEDVEVPVQEERGDRHRRVTCDLLSISTPWGSVNHAACAAHCLAMMKGYRGGRCINGVCNCRR